MAESQKKITIIGAGLSGLTAAYRLQNMGYKPSIYEARHRCGGRVLTAQVGRSFEEVGGKNFLDGGDPIHSKQLIRDLGLILQSYEIPYNPYYVNQGRVYELFDILKDYNRTDGVFDKIQEVASRSSNLLEVIQGTFEDEDLQLILKGAIRGYEGSEPDQLDVSCADSLYFIYKMFVDQMNNAAQGKPSVFPWLNIKGGNSQLPLAISACLERKIEYGQHLTGIHLLDNRLSLKFNNEHVIHTDILLMTIPCTMYAGIDISPGIFPGETLNRLNQVQYGTSSKILFSYSQREVTREVFASPVLFSWSNDVDNVRTLFFGGDYGKYDLKSAREIFDHGSQMFSRINPNMHLTSKGFVSAKDSQYVVYNETIYKSWGNDPFVKGSYVNRAPGTASWLSQIETFQDEKVRSVFKPIENRIFFAGEHTTVLDTFGTLEAAIESGERAAQLIHKTLLKD